MLRDSRSTTKEIIRVSDALSNNQTRQFASACILDVSIFFPSAIAVASEVRNLKNRIAVVNNDHRPFADLFKTHE